MNIFRIRFHTSTLVEFPCDLLSFIFSIRNLTDTYSRKHINILGNILKHVCVQLGFRRRGGYPSDRSPY